MALEAVTCPVAAARELTPKREKRRPNTPREGVGQCGPENRHLCPDINPQPLQSGGADDNHHANESDDYACDSSTRHLLVPGEEMCDDDGKDGSYRIKNRSQTTRNMRLAPNDETKRDSVVEDAHTDKGPPHSGLPGQALTHHPEHHVKCRGGERDTQRNNGKRRQRIDDHADEKERPSPQDGERNQHRPIHPVHPLSNHHAVPANYLRISLTVRINSGIPILALPRDFWGFDPSTVSVVGD